jgi:hypothetical protein
MFNRRPASAVRRRQARPQFRVNAAAAGDVDPFK